MTQAYAAASLSLSQGRWRDAEKAVAGGLAADDIGDVDAAALRQLMSEIHFRQSLDAQGKTLAGGEIRLSVCGPGIRPGAAPLAAVYGRARQIGKLLSGIAGKDACEIMASPPQADGDGCAVILRFVKAETDPEPPLAELVDALRKPPPDADDATRRALQAIAPDGKAVHLVQVTADTETGVKHCVTLPAP